MFVHERTGQNWNFDPDDNICKPRNVNLLVEKLKYHQNTPQTTKMSTFNTNPPNLLHQSKPGGLVVVDYPSQHFHPE